ncbi:MAG TPA: ABC transporter permease, partial [Flavobacteriaceae bacterium]|nr:ABC transporter permease [Flavobacteriaceae bacterium]
MLNYVLHKIGYALLTLFGVVTVVFFLFTVLPGDPAKMMLGQNQSEEQLAVVRSKYGFDQPISTQYLYYLNDLSPISIHSENPLDYTFLSEGKYNALPLFSIGDYILVLKTPYLRESFQKNGKEVSAVIAETLPNTIVLAVSAIIIALILGIFFGIVSALKKDSWIDNSIQVFSTVGMSVPSFFSSIIFAWLFGYVLHEFTHLNMTGSLYELGDFGEEY